MLHAVSSGLNTCAARSDRMDYYGASDKGLKRAVNEDSYCCVVNANNDFLACVCDGIGGSSGRGSCQ